MSVRHDAIVHASVGCSKTSAGPGHLSHPSARAGTGRAPSVPASSSCSACRATAIRCSADPSPCTTRCSTPAGKPIGIDVVYLVVGKMTGRLAACGPAIASRCGARSATASPIRTTDRSRRPRRRRHRPDAVSRPHPRSARHARLRRPVRRAARSDAFRSTTACARPISPPASTTSAAPARGPSRQQRRQPRLSRLRDATARAARTRRSISSAAAPSRCCTRSRSWRQRGRAVSCVAGDADGVRRRHLLQLRDAGADGRRLGLPPRLRGRPDLRCGEPGVGHVNHKLRLARYTERYGMVVLRERRADRTAT